MPSVKQDKKGDCGARPFGLKYFKLLKMPSVHLPFALPPAI